MINIKTSKEKRLRRSRKTRYTIKRNGQYRLCANKTSRHIYAQIISPDGTTTIAGASTLEKSLIGKNKTDSANLVGKAIAERAKEKNIDQVAFDRSGFPYHGRIKALAEAAIEAGLKI